MAKKSQGKTAPKKKATPKAAQPATTAKKVQTSPQGDPPKAKTPKLPTWLKPFPVDYIVGTEDYAAIVMDHNEKFGTDYNRWRVQPQVFYTIHQRILSHYNEQK